MNSEYSLLNIDSNPLRKGTAKFIMLLNLSIKESKQKFIGYFNDTIIVLRQAPFPPRNSSALPFVELVKTRLSRNTQTTLSAGFSSNWSFKSCSCFVKRYKYISSFQLFTKLFSVLQSLYSQSTKLQILIMMIMITYQTFPKWTKSFLDWAFQEWFKSSTGIWIFGKCTVAIWLCSVIGDSNPW